MLARALARLGVHPSSTIRQGPARGMRLALAAGAAEPYVGGGYEPAVTAALERLVHPGDVCADLGAHVGYFSLVMAALSGPEGRVLAVEASPTNVELVRRTVRLNDLSERVSVVHAAVGPEGAGSLMLYPGRQGGSAEWTTSLEFAAREGHRVDERTAVEVPTLALDAHFAPGAPLAVVKMDIEGAERDAIPGMSRVLREARPTIVLEFHREVGWPAIPALVEAGYRFETLDGEPAGPFADASDVPYQLVALGG